MKSRDFLRRIHKDGWTHARTVGSHQHFHHPRKPGTITVAGRVNDEIPKGTLHSMWKQAGLAKEESSCDKPLSMSAQRQAMAPYIPDLPGLGGVAKTLEESKELIRTGMTAHVAMMREHS